MKNSVVSVVIGVFLFSCACTTEKGSLTTSFDMDLKLEKKKLNQGEPNYLTLIFKNISDQTIRIPDREMVLEFTSYSGSVRRTIPVRELSNDMSELENITGIRLKPGEVKSVQFELGEIVFGQIRNSDKALPADDYTINIFMKNSGGHAIADNIRTNYVDVLITN